MAPNDKILQISSFTFDASVEQIFLSILHGASLYIIKRRLSIDANELTDFIEKNEIGESKLYSLEAFKTRFDKDIMNAYLDGRYGSVPKFKFLNKLIIYNTQLKIYGIRIFCNFR